MKPGTLAPEASRQHGALRVALAALALGWRAAPKASALLLGLTVLTGILPSLVAWVGKLLFDDLSRGPATDVPRAVGLAATVAILGGFATVGGQCLSLAGARVQQAATLRAEGLLYARVNAFLGLRNFENPALHDRLRLAEQAVESAPQDILSFAVEVTRRSVLILTYGGILLSVWPPIAVFLLAAAAPAFAAQVVLARQHANVIQASMAWQRRRFYFRSLFSDPEAAQEIRLFGLGQFFHGRMVAALHFASASEMVQIRRRTVADSFFTLVNVAVSSLAAVFAVRAMAAGRLTLGDLTLFLASIAAVQGAFAGIVSQFGQARRGLLTFPNYLGLVNAPPDLVDGSRCVPELTGEIEFRGVWFKYGERDDRWILRDLNLKIPCGASVGLVGVNGAGKSTLIKLLLRFYDPDQGQILWNGLDLRELRSGDLRERITVTFQSYVQYELTAAENIGLGSLPRFNDMSCVQEAAERSGVDATILNLPQGYRTLLSRTFFDEDCQAGVNLSGGQWQKVALARSFMRSDADLLVLDEPSARLDPDAEYKLHEALLSQRAGRTNLLVSHRLNTLRHADIIVVLGHGRVRESGTHDELMNLGQEYARLFALQATGYQDDRLVKHREPQR